MPVKDKTPAALRSYRALGVQFGKVDEAQAHAEECPFCDRGPNKFSVVLATTQYHCVVCGADGNALTFAREVAEQGTCTDDEAAALAADRGFLDPKTVRDWGLVKSPITREWVWPQCTHDGRLCSLARYEYHPPVKKRILKGMTTNGVEEVPDDSGLSVGMFGVPLFDQAKPTVYVCESWNAPALWEVLKLARDAGDGALELTGVESDSLAAGANVIGVPGANVWQDRWSRLLAGKRVVLMVDNDHPKFNKKQGKNLEGAGTAGARRTAALLVNATEPPESIHVVLWGPGDDEWPGYSKDLPSGYDLRDALVAAGSDPGEKVRALAGVLKLVHPIPAGWVPGRGAGAARGSPHLVPMDCRTYADLVRAWRPAMHWSDDLDHMMTVCLAAVVSTETRGEQIWVMAMAPPSSGKTTIVDAIGVARDYIWMKSVLNKIHSGYKEDKEGSKDFGDVPMLKNKTVIVKDGDPLLQDPNRGLILAQYRDIYDGSASIKYGHGVMFNHEGVRFTMIICGTAKLRELDAVEAGARYIYCSFNEHPDAGRERQINFHLAYRALRDVRAVANGSVESHHDPDLIRAKRMTGGYVNYLRRNAEMVLSAVRMSDESVERVIVFGEFCAFLRARPPKWQDEVTEREMSHRLVSQFIRLAVCLAAVRNKDEVDAEVLVQVRRVALDTARGRTLNLATALYRHGRDGRTAQALESELGEGADKVLALCKFLVQIGVCERVPATEANALQRPGKRWRLTPRVEKLYREVCGDA